MLPQTPFLQAPPRDRDLSRYQNDILGYARDVLQVSLTPDQTAILLSVQNNRRTAAKASHAIGKTFSAAIAACWWYDCWDQHIVYITAPTWDQCLGLTFKQIKLFRLERGLPGDILDTGLVRDPERAKQPGHFIKALNAQTGEGFQGEHTSPILIIMEEAVGVAVHIWQATDGLMTHPDCRTLSIANPTDEATHFGLACDTPLYNVITVCAMEHPNIHAELKREDPPFPKAVRLLWLREMLEKECEPADIGEGEAFEYYSLSTLDEVLEGRPIWESAPKSWYRPTAEFQGRVLGEFPTQADEQCIPKGWLRTLPTDLSFVEHEPIIGCDVARFGADRTAIAIRRGPKLLKLLALRQLDNIQVTQRLREEAAWAASHYNASLALAVAFAEALGADAKRPKPIAPTDVQINIDVTGGLGTGPFDQLKSEGYRIAPCNASSKPVNEEQFHNRRSEMWWVMRDRVREKRLDLSLIEHELRATLIHELSSPKYKVDGGGRKVVEPKEKLKERLKCSPDLADAVNLAFAQMGRWWEDRTLLDWLAKRHTGAAETPAAESVPVTDGGANIMAAFGG